MKKVGVLILLLLSISLSISFASAMSYQVVEWKDMKTGDVWRNISGGYNVVLNSLLSPNVASINLIKYSTSQINLTKGVLFQYNVEGYVFNVSSISISSGNNGNARLVILKKICTPDWKCESWGQCIDGGQWRICKDINECGVSTGMPHESQACTVVCSPSWACSVWSSCVNNQQTRTCKDGNKCDTLAGEPSLTQACQPNPNDPNAPVSECTEDWQCTQWSSCVNNLFTRVCTDSNNCGTNNNKPRTSLACTDECLESWRCSSWSQCINNQQIRTCNDLNDCETFAEIPSLLRVCNSESNNPNSGNNNPNPSGSSIPDSSYIFSGQGWSYPPVNFSIHYILPEPINIDIPIPNLFNPDFFLWWLLLLLLYIYLSLTYTFIGRRAKVYHYGIAWVPLIGPMLVSSRAAKMGSWPILLLVAVALSTIAETILMFTPFLVFAFVMTYLNSALIITFLVYWIIWTWRMFRAVNRPGWWSLVNIIPILGWIAFLIFLGVAAWGKFDDSAKIAKKPKKK